MNYATQNATQNHVNIVFMHVLRFIKRVQFPSPPPKLSLHEPLSRGFLFSLIDLCYALTYVNHKK